MDRVSCSQSMHQGEVLTQLNLEPKFYNRRPLPREPKSQDVAGSRLRSVVHLDPVLKPPTEPLASTSAHQPVLPSPGVPHGPRRRWI